MLPRDLCCFTKKLLVQRDWAAVKIQTAFRRHACRQQLKRSISSAVRIQSAFRRLMACHKAALLRKEKQRLLAAVYIQRRLRGHLVRRELRHRQQAATIIQVMTLPAIAPTSQDPQKFLQLGTCVRKSKLTAPIGTQSSADNLIPPASHQSTGWQTNIKSRLRGAVKSAGLVSLVWYAALVLYRQW